MSRKDTVTKETDYLIIGAGAMGIAFADELFTQQPQVKLTIVDRRAKAGGHWNDAYPFVRLHQPAVFYGVNSLELSNGGTDLSSKSEILAYYEKIIAKFIASGRVEFLAQHNYLGNGQVTDLQNPEKIITYKINKKLVDATYMNVSVPSTHAPKYIVEEGVPLVPINALEEEYNNWEKFYVIGSGKTGMDAVLFLLKKGVPEGNIYWIVPNDAWLFNRAHIQPGKATFEIIGHALSLKNASKVEDIFVEMEKKGGIMRLDKNFYPQKWRCATVNPDELAKLKSIKNIIRKGRVKRITALEMELQQDTIAYSGKTLFVDCSANALSKRKKTPIFSESKITLQSVIFCQQVFSSAIIARMEMAHLSDLKKNKLVPVPHPDYKEDWPSALSVSIENLFLANRYFPLWMFRSRLNIISHEPIHKFLYYAAKFLLHAPAIKKAAKRLDKLQKND